MERKLVVDLLNQVELTTALSSDLSAGSLVFLLGSHAGGGALIFVSLQVVSANGHFSFSATTLLGVDVFALSPVNGLSSSEAVQVARVQVGSSVSSANGLLLVAALAFSENFRVVNFVVSANSVVLFSDFGAFHQALVSVGLVVDTTDRDVSLVALAVGSD